MKFTTAFTIVGALSAWLANAADDNETDHSVTEIEPKCFKQNYYINAAGDMKDLHDCQIISGNIFVKGYDSDSLDLGSISHIKGSLSIANASSLLRIEGVELSTIDGTFALDTLTSLASISLPKLESIDTISWKVLPILSAVNLDKGIKHINSVVMSDTSLTGFSGFNVESLKVLNINNNRFLERIDSSVKEITDTLLITANARNLQVSLPELTWAHTITIKDTNNLNLDSLQVVENSAQFINNRFSDLKLPKLKSTGTTLSVINNKNVRTIEFPSLAEVGGGLMIIDNDLITKVDFFPVLRAIGGAIEFHGNIDASGFKQLKVVKGSAIIKSTSAEFDCNKWIKEEVSNVVRGGKIECGSGSSRSTEVLLVDESGDITKGTPGVNSGVAEQDKSKKTVVKSGTSVSYKVGFSAIVTGLAMSWLAIHL
ncbi:hypothetical protein OGAPHI_007297 [Ogataea philodendri]|uniref:Sporulation-specific protein 22 n=1 Tax=Ogataea philodendri TaxID=1378263 RepID=A0A9P8NUW9_9ASCO|nr:uncharacterized protein OGAPHI_007297 [Ogataea philodendri]KAH3660092.1 hypothetical protein OGAPHI_007297 [Ogataea philodendri]